MVKKLQEGLIIIIASAALLILLMAFYIAAVVVNVMVTQENLQYYCQGYLETQ